MGTLWHSCIVLSFIVIPCLFAKPFNLNEAIAAEERQKGLHTTTTRPKLEPETSERFSLNKVLRTSPIKFKRLKPKEKSERFSLSKILKTNPVKFKKLKATDYPRGKKISSLQYKKTFQIKSPLKPKKLKTIEKARHRRRNQSIKREINQDEKISKKYIPLLRSLGLLFGNILSEADDSFEIRSGKLRKYRHSKRNNTGCSCSGKSDEIGDTASTKKTTVSTGTFDPISTDQPTQRATTQAPATTTDRASISDFSDLGQNTDVPAVLPRNTASARRDHNGVGERSRPTLHTSLEGNISGDFGNSERHTGSGEYRSDTKDYEEDPYGATREHASSIEFRRGLRGDRPDIRRPVYRRGLDQTVFSAERQDNDNLREDRRNFNEFEGQVNTKREDSLRHFGGDVTESPGENQYEIGGDETESPKFVQQFVRGDRRFLSEESVVNTELVQPQEELEEGVVGIKHYIAGDQRLLNGDGPSTPENKKNGPTNAALISIKDLNSPVIMLQNGRKHKPPFVTIIDGYSVARDKNGANKLAEQSIRFHS